jgi:hypothetical protein
LAFIRRDDLVISKANVRHGAAIERLLSCGNENFSTRS